MSINLSKKFTPYVQTVTGSADVTVTQLLRYHMPLLYCMQPFIFILRYSQTRLIRTLLIRHFCLIRQGNLRTLKPLPLTPMLDQPFSHPS